MNFFGKYGPFGGRDPFQPQATLVDPEQSQDFPCFLDDLAAFHITIQVIAVADMSAGDQQPVGSFQ